MKKKITLYVLLVVVIIGIIATFIILNYKKEDSQPNEETINSENIGNTVKNSPTPITNVSEMTNQDKSIFNSNFDIYTGTNVESKEVKYLISSIKYSNENSSIRKVDLIINGKKSTNSNEIKTTSTYSVSFEYDDDGLICKAIVEEN